MSTNAYFSYLIRIWQNDDTLPNHWHASLEDPSTHQITHFSTLEALLAFLKEKCLVEVKIHSQD